MANVTSTSSILQSQPGRNSSKISELSSKLQDAVAVAADGAAYKYDSRAKLESSGLGDIYDRTQRSLLMAENNKININTTFAKLSNDERFLEDINAAVVGFEKELVKSDAFSAKSEKADRALEKIEHILTKKDEAGRYVFGGNNPYTNPLTRIDANGNPVQIKLTETSNLVDKLVTTNYASGSGPNNSLVTLSSSHEAKESFLYPSMKAVADIIAFINMYKKEENTFTPEEFEVAQKQQKDSYGAVSILVGLEIEKIKQAREVNKSDIKTATDVNASLFQGDLVESAGLVRDLMQSMLANVTLNQVSNNVFNTLLEKTRI
jgi:hypothetical protein